MRSELLQRSTKKVSRCYGLAAAMVGGWALALPHRGCRPVQACWVLGRAPNGGFLRRSGIVSILITCCVFFATIGSVVADHTADDWRQHPGALGRRVSVSRRAAPGDSPSTIRSRAHRKGDSSPDRTGRSLKSGSQSSCIRVGGRQDAWLRRVIFTAFDCFMVDADNRCQRPFGWNRLHPLPMILPEPDAHCVLR